MKYPNYRKIDDATVMAMAEGTHTKSDLGKTKPSLMLKDLRATRDPAEEGELVRPAPPQILEFLNIEDYSAQKQCSVPLEHPLFQPYPAELVFRNFEPFGTYHQRLYFRNTTLLPDAFAYYRQTRPSFPSGLYLMTHRLQCQRMEKLRRAWKFAILLPFGLGKSVITTTP